MDKQKSIIEISLANDFEEDSLLVVHKSNTLTSLANLAPVGLKRNSSSGLTGHSPRSLFAAKKKSGSSSNLSNH